MWWLREEISGSSLLNWCAFVCSGSVNLMAFLYQHLMKWTTKPRSLMKHGITCTMKMMLTRYMNSESKVLCNYSSEIKLNFFLDITDTFDISMKMQHTVVISLYLLHVLTVTVFLWILHDYKVRYFYNVIIHHM